MLHPACSLPPSRLICLCHHFIRSRELLLTLGCQLLKLLHNVVNVGLVLGGNPIELQTDMFVFHNKIPLSSWRGTERLYTNVIPMLTVVTFRLPAMHLIAVFGDFFPADGDESTFNIISTEIPSLGSTKTTDGLSIRLRYHCLL